MYIDGDLEVVCTSNQSWESETEVAIKVLAETLAKTGIPGAEDNP
jgi:hypothetical protein